MACATVLGACGGYEATMPPEEVKQQEVDPRQASPYAEEWYENYGIYMEGSRREIGEEYRQPQQELGAAEESAAPIAYEEYSIDPALREACGMKEPEAYFPTGSTEVLPGPSDDLEQLARCLQESPLGDDYISIVGHADPRGDEEYNLELALRRADAVARRLQAEGVAAERIDTYSRGEYFASADPEDWPKNRRVEIRLDR